ncbi:MAG: oligoribonuclease, partial [Betaproteobacteria bacterium]|nr:oligoribonuclease [Betaproteobacteria bacterium]
SLSASGLRSVSVMMTATSRIRSTSGRRPLISISSQIKWVTLGFLAAWVPSGKSPMCGNSIGQDRRFMARYMPELERYFHYRNLDVSTLKELCKRWRPDLIKGFDKRSAHTALADIRESIEELQYYKTHFLRHER